MDKSGMLEISPVITASRLDIGYSKETIVGGIEFSLRAGQSLALVGVNGSGKTTLLKTLVGLLPTLAGNLDVLGTLPGKSPARIAYLSQFHASSFILPMRAIDVVRMGRFANHGLLGRMDSEDEAIVIQSMQRMGIANLAKMPLRSLSGGQQQRVYITQSLARRADVLILDEPTSGLDASGKEIYQQVIVEELSRGAAAVVATHDIQEAMNSSCAMLLARKVIAYGKGAEIITPQSLLETFGIVITTQANQTGIMVVEREHEHNGARKY
ncbi:MAG TPA: ATP-binding cassette domain-containing protein [Anaerolineaceae bacterium]|nr:ATP-binding cassette domain-containing protein [Anaerolineaceae bacterium]